MARKMKVLDKVATTLVIVGALNWGLVGWFDFNLVSWLATITKMPVVETVVYSLVAISAIWAGYKLLKR